MRKREKREREPEDSGDITNRKNYTANSLYFTLDQGGCSFGPDASETPNYYPSYFVHIQYHGSKYAHRWRMTFTDLGWVAAAQQYHAYSPNTQNTCSHKSCFVGRRVDNPGVCTADLTSATSGVTAAANGSPACVPTCLSIGLLHHRAVHQFSSVCKEQRASVYSKSPPWIFPHLPAKKWC